MTPEEIKENNKNIAQFMGYKYFESGVIYDVGDYYKHFQAIDVYSKVPIEVDNYGDQKYFMEIPNPDFGNENNPRWDNERKTLKWSTINCDHWTYDLKYHCDWNELMPVFKKLLHELNSYKEQLKKNSEGLFERVKTMKHIDDCESVIKCEIWGVRIKDAFYGIAETIKLYNEKWKPLLNKIS